MPNLMLIALAIAPVGGSHSTRLTHLAKELALRGWDLTVVTTKIYPGTPEYDASLLRKIPKNVTLIRSFPGPLHYCSYRKPSSGGASFGKSSKLKRFLIPDTYIEWLPGALWELFKNRRVLRKPDLILSSALPYTSHLIGLLLHWLYRKPWVADYGDPWVYDPGRPRKGLRFLIERCLETLVLKNCSAIIVTTANTKQLYLDKYGLDKERVIVLPMAYDPDDFRGGSRMVSRSDPGRIRFLYTGRLEPESRNIQPFLEALQKLKYSGKSAGYSFEFAGSFHADLQKRLVELGLKSQIKFHPWLEHVECMKLLIDSDFLLLFGNNNSIQVPGKVFNYLGSGTPIIYITDIATENDPVLDLLKRSGRRFWVVQNDANALAEFFLNLPKSRTAENSQTVDFYENSWGQRAEALSNLLHSLRRTDKS